jgi:hypothetical protein
MAEAQTKDEFEFEIEGEAPSSDRQTPEQIRQEQINLGKQKAKEDSNEDEDESGIKIVDDTPLEDRDRQPLPKSVLAELEADELEEYSERAQERLKQMRKVWHDERRAKEAAYREQQEAIGFAQKMMEENKKLKTRLSEGEKSFIDTVKNAAELELEMAKRAYKEARETGDADRELEAQQKLSDINFKIQRIKDYRPSLQEPDNVVNSNPDVSQQAPRLDPKTAAWQERNTWWGADEEMTALALGYHQKLEKQFGRQYVGTDDYWQRVDETMRKRFPDYDWGDAVEKPVNGGGRPVQRTEKPANVVAPASRSTSSKKIVLTQREVSLARKLNLTPEQYAKEKMRLENQNG